jgi:predicted metalloprotease
VKNPIHVSQPRRLKVRTEENNVIEIAPIRVKITVHAPWLEMALKAVEMETMPAAEMRTWATRI